MSEATLTIAGFILARVAEDDAWARAAELGKSFDPIEWPTEGEPNDPARVLARCAADRRIVARCESVTMPPDAPDLARTAWDAFNILNRATLRDLASVYADHPDYREEWA